MTRAMNRHVVRYTTKPGQGDENARLIQNVFLELSARAPAGLRYAVLRLSDDTFVHLVEREEGTSPLQELESFRAFSGTVKERALAPPQFTDAVVVGNYRMIADR
jgi:hypothetical protein